MKFKCMALRHKQEMRSIKLSARYSHVQKPLAIILLFFAHVQHSLSNRKELLHNVNIQNHAQKTCFLFDINEQVD